MYRFRLKGSVQEPGPKALIASDSSGLVLGGGSACSNAAMMDDLWLRGTPSGAEHLASLALHVSEPSRLPERVVAATQGLTINGLSQLLHPNGPQFEDAVQRDDDLIHAGMAIHADDFDDTDPIGGTHPTAVLLPAALGALTLRSTPLSGACLLAALSAGYEVTGRLARAAPHMLTRTGFHATSVFGALGAATTAGLILGLDGRKLASALGIAASQSSGLIQSVFEGGNLKLFHCGWAAVCGLHAARWAAKEVVLGPRLAIEGPYGLLNGFAARRDMVPNHEKLYADGFLLETIEVKRYPCCHFLHALIDLVLQFRREYPELPITSIETMECTVPKEARDVVCEPRMERLAASGYNRKFSLQQVAALTAIHGAPKLGWFELNRSPESPDVQSLVERVEYLLSEDPAIRLGYGAHLRVRAHGRVIFEGQVSAGEAEPASLDMSFLKAKFLGSLQAHGFSRADSELRWDEATGLLGATDALEALRRLLR